jgi:hypothetical protein
MSPEDDARWTFEPVNPNASGASGKISDLFRNDGVEERGHLAVDSPTTAATLMAREVIQNSWDAAEELRRDDDTLPPFELDFRFMAAAGDTKDQLVEAMGLRQLAEHASAVAATTDDRKKIIGLAANDCLGELNTAAPLSYCEIVERGATGMYGPWSGAESRMYLAMASIGYTEKPDGSGGTFGYGKAGLIRASRPRIVFGYSCFRERKDDAGITRRLLGMAYWGRHKRDDETFTGFVRFGDRQAEDAVAPFENDAADHIAEALGLELRNPAVPTQLGTTFLVIDPLVEPDDLRSAVERNWWPALVDDRFTVVIARQDDQETFCRPKSNPQLAAFVDAYEIIKSGALPGDGRKAVLRGLGHYHPVEGSNLPLGQLALVADPDGWSFPDEPGADDETYAESRSLVALTRDPRMIVEYHLPGRDISRRVPYIRGIFVASHELNPELAKTEPKAHDNWDSRDSDDVPAAATKYAREIANRIRNEVKRFQDELRPPVDESGAVRLRRLDEKLAKLRNQQGKNPPPPPPGSRPFRFILDVRREQRDDDLILRGHVDVRLADDVEASEIAARLRFTFAIDEDGKRGTEIPLAITPPVGFELTDGDASRFDGAVTTSPVRFELESEPYRSDWTGELLVSGEERIEEGEAAA